MDTISEANTFQVFVHECLPPTIDIEMLSHCKLVSMIGRYFVIRSSITYNDYMIITYRSTARIIIPYINNLMMVFVKNFHYRIVKK